jgi:hypothetical protein
MMAGSSISVMDAAKQDEQLRVHSGDVAVSCSSYFVMYAPFW